MSTRMIASSSVFTISSIEALIGRVESITTSYAMSGGNRVLASSRIFRTLSAVSIALAPGARKMPIAPAGDRFKRARKS